MATPGKAGGDAEMWIQLIEAFGGAVPKSAGLTDLWIALINAVEAFAGGGGGASPATTVTGPPTFNSSPVVGVGLNYAREDHSHGGPVLNPASSSTGPAGFGTSPVTGTSLAYARQDHSHGNPTFPGTAQLAPVQVVYGSIPDTGTGALTGLPIIDGYQTQVNDRILVPHSYAFGSNVPNGIWLAQTGAWTRPTDFANGSTFTQAFVMALGGTYRAGTLWACTSQSTITVGTTAQVWTNVAHTDPGEVWMTDYLEVVDFDNPFTDPVWARGQAIVNTLPFLTYYKSNGTTINTYEGTVHWPTTEFPLICGWAATISSRGNPNLAARAGCMDTAGLQTALVRDLGEGSDNTILISCFPTNFIQLLGETGSIEFGPLGYNSSGTWDYMTIKGDFSLCGTGYVTNAMNFMKTKDLVVANFGPTPAPGVTAVTAGGSTLQAGGWEIITTVAGSKSTVNWSGTNWAGWSDNYSMAGGYTLGPDESQPSAGQQVITTTGQGIQISLPAYITPQPPWGYNVYLRPVMQFSTSSLGTTPLISGFTGAQTITCASNTPPLGLPSSNGTFYVAVTNTASPAQSGLAQITYSTLSGNTFSGCQYHQQHSSIGPGNGAFISGGLPAGGAVMYNADATSIWNNIYTNQSPGPAPNGTPLVFSSAWSQRIFPTPDTFPSSQGYLGTGVYCTGGANAPAVSQAFPEKMNIDVTIIGCGNALVFDAGKPPGFGSTTSFAYQTWRPRILCPPGMNGIIFINGVNAYHDWFDIGTNWSVNYDAGGWWGAIQGTGGTTGQQTYQTMMSISGTYGSGIVVPGGGNVVSILLQASVLDGDWRMNFEVDGSPPTGGLGQLTAQWLQNAICYPTDFLIDAGGTQPYSAGQASSFTNMTGFHNCQDTGHLVGASVLPPGGLGTTNGGTWTTGGGSLVASATPQNGGFSFNGPIRGDAKMISLAGGTGTGPTVVCIHGSTYHVI